ncbi:sigma-54-dependent Fis family transcriptional regulator [Wohlfahrtiimonas chitiniclastica]|uniref:Type 4 fimbriae expression regulatory protein PilR n=1 Tax=Wohlfahrtiimonas chitiniclastica SH04 TaxID=1261130 RepID=L8Y0A4_9GAMM|nr:sigma-54 dependent transcriptional regulator [Wohlfahrtiimonas chitiniclastica]ELV08425.1 Type 4 fimbriae expression regulatory protein PilR [Wohlfahrtiimonas chitiniclastica SH04]MBS7815121.1 sigma-54-dependent Fis family transcriptional regulator [Wohlfahrtiimonas chitiniclastica]MBS7833888.1 sigma-54-dependent Fis family transcriptional regulator [Wohlfahrtiimonas chitiniclastica]MDC7252903.1 type 4 fimbriae expression regulatory protein PilR [Wohlfahrtiimonas chitiniclastica]OYQ80946.1 
MYKALIIDDEENICELISMSFLSIDIECVEAYSVSDAIVALQNEAFDVCLTDLKLPDGSGFDVLRYIQDKVPNLPVAMMTAHGNVESAIEALKLGAFDFISKPFEINALRKLALNAVQTQKIPQVASKHGLYGDSVAMVSLRNQIRKLARSQSPIYITGESGVGKEVVARAIHAESPRFDGPFIAVNCGALSEHLVESELFGHKKGSFTGADKDKKGLFQAADGGTLLLDEIADLPLSMQVKLLRAIQERAIRPIGAMHEIPVNVRILSASHKSLAALVDAGEFRQDLFYRLNVISLHVPPLRERRGDVAILVKVILERLNHDNGRAVTITEGALRRLDHYAFPGNVRELENILERASTLCDGDVIEEKDLLLNSNNELVLVSGVQNAPPPMINDLMDTGDQEDPVIPDHIDDIEAYLAAVERKILKRALAEHDSKTEAAKQLGISFRTFRYRLKKLNIEDDD